MEQHEKMMYSKSEKVEKMMYTIRGMVAWLNENGYGVSEYALRLWIMQGKIPVRRAGRTMLLYRPNVIAFLECADGCDNPPPVAAQGIRRVV